MTRQDFPSRGGSYERQKDGKLKCVAQTEPAEGRGGKNPRPSSAQDGKAAKSKE